MEIPDLAGLDLTPAELEQLDQLIRGDTTLWRPLPGPQTDAFNSEADVVGYGGAAGGGKTDLCCGLALTRHRRVGIFRQVGTELTAVVDRFEELVGGRDGYNGQLGIWRLRRPDGVMVQIELGSFPNPGDEKKYRGRPHDLLWFDEAAEMREAAFRFVSGWARTVVANQRVRIGLSFNPPTTVEGRWIVDYFGPWLDEMHPAYPVPAGELRWFAVVNGKEQMVDGPEPFVHNGERVIPKSRTFIPSRVSDNPYLMGTNYEAQLQALPEPLRSQMLYGDFAAGMKDDIWQVIPTAWVKEAQARWTNLQPKPPMTGQGVDVARGGDDETIIYNRHDKWWDMPRCYPGEETPDGPKVAGLVIAARRNNAPIHIDVIGVGSSPFDFLSQMQLQVVGVNVSEASHATDQSGVLSFANLRSELWWKAREALDPANNHGLALPPHPQLLKDLCAPKWQVRGKVIYVQSREEIVKKIGRSPDHGSAFVLSLINTPRRDILLDITGRRQRPVRKDYDPYEHIGE